MRVNMAATMRLVLTHSDPVGRSLRMSNEEEEISVRPRTAAPERFESLSCPAPA